jgi:hypothetical protein
MRFKTKTGLLAVVACLAVLGAGAASASAVTTLKTGGTALANNSVISSGLHSGSSATLHSGLGNIVCNASTFSSTLTGNAIEPATLSTTALSFSSCTSGVFGYGTVNSVVSNNKPYTTTATNTTGTDGTVTISGVDVTINLSGFLGTLVCEYAATGGSANGDVDNSVSSLDFVTIPVTKVSGGILCPTSGVTFDATYDPLKSGGVNVTLN